MWGPAGGVILPAGVAPPVACGALKNADDLALYFAFRRHAGTPDKDEVAPTSRQ